MLNCLIGRNPVMDITKPKWLIKLWVRAQGSRNEPVWKLVLRTPIGLRTWFLHFRGEMPSFSVICPSYDVSCSWYYIVTVFLPHAAPTPQCQPAVRHATYRDPLTWTLLTINDNCSTQVRQTQPPLLMWLLCWIPSKMLESFCSRWIMKVSTHRVRPSSCTPSGCDGESFGRCPW